MEMIFNALPLMLGQRDKLDTLITQLLRDSNDLQTLCSLSHYMKIKIEFNRPVNIRINYRRHKEILSFIFTKLMFSNSRLYHGKRNSRYLYPLYLESIKSIEPLLETSIYFKDYEEFKKKFNPLFITEDEIYRLFNETSYSGQRFNKTDFRTIGKRGREVLKQFMVHFKGVTKGGGEGYTKSFHGDYKILHKHYSSYRHPGRDITIEHNENIEYVWYSSEKHGCGNGRYGLVVNRNEYLWLEDD